MTNHKFDLKKALGATAIGLIGMLFASHQALGEETAVRAGVQAAPPDEVYLAKDWADPYRVDIEYTQFSSGGDMLQAFLAGRIDVANAGSARIVTLAAKQPEKFYIIGTHQYGGDRYGVIVSKDSAAEQVSDLKGEKLGAVTGSGAYNVFLLYLSRQGMSESDFKVVNMKAEDIPSSVQSGIVDAGVVWEPFPSIAESNGTAKRIASMKGVNESPVFFVVNRAFADENPEAVTRYLAAMIDAGSFMKQSPEKAGAIAAEKISERGVGISPEALALSFTRFDVASPVTDELLQELEPVSENMMNIGKIEQIPDFKSLVRPEFYESALALSGDKS